RPALTTEERAGDTPRRVHPLLDIHRKREEVQVVLRLLRRGCRREQHGFVVQIRHDRTGCLLGEPAGLEPDGAGTERTVVEYGFGLVHAVSGCISHRFSSPRSLLRTLRPQPSELPSARRRHTRATMPVIDRSCREYARQPLPRTGRGYLACGSHPYGF